MMVDSKTKMQLTYLSLQLIVSLTAQEELPGPHVHRVLPTANCSDDKSQPEPPQCLAELAPDLGCGSAPTNIAESSSVFANDVTVSDCQAVCCNNRSEVYQPKQIRFC